MRMIAENAGSCDEAFEIIKKAVREGICGSAGNGRGMIFLFSDREKGLIVENTSKSFVYEFIEDGVFCRTNDYLLPGAVEWIDDSGGDIPSVKSSRIRLARAREILSGGEITPKVLKELSRDTLTHPFGVNNDAEQQPTMTLSALINVISKKKTELLSCARVCHGNPSYACYFPFYIGGVSTPAVYCDSHGKNGELFSKQLRVSDKQKDELESAEAVFYEQEESFLQKIAPGAGAAPEECLMGLLLKRIHAIIASYYEAFNNRKRFSGGGWVYGLYLGKEKLG